MNEDKSARYHRLKRRIGIAGLVWSAVFLLLLVLSGGAVSLRDRLEMFTGSRPAVLGSVVIVLALLHESGSLPLAWYSGHVLEHRYGLSRQTRAQWLGDHLKGFALGLVLAIGLAGLVYLTMTLWPDRWWLVSATAFSVILIVFAHLAPVLLLPLFFRIRPLEQPTLRERLERLAHRAGAQVVGVYQWDLGQKTVKANAALTGMGNTRRILVADTMLNQFSEDEIEVVLAHELAHHVHGDIWRGIVLETALTVAGFYAAHRVLLSLGARVGLTDIADPAGIPLLLLAAGAVSVLLMPVALAVSRAHERRADRFALDLTRNPAAFATAMRRLGAQNLAEERPSRVVQWLFYSHPPLEERVRRAGQWQAPASGEVGA